MQEAARGVSLIIMMALTNEALLETVRTRLVAGILPDKIIVFGTRSRGDARFDSDLDLVVVANLPGSLGDRSRAVRAHLMDLPVPMDVVVYTPEEFARLREWRSSIAGIADRDGRVLHG